MAQLQGSSTTLEKEASGSTILQVNSPVHSWLNALGLPEYGQLFKKYHILEDILHLTETDIRDLGVRNGAHRARMISNLVMIRESSSRRMRPRLQETGPIDKSASDYSLSSSLASSFTTPLPNTAHQGAVYQPFSGFVQSRNTGSPSADCMSGDLTMQSWYHARISRIEAERLVSQEGMFLIRDSFTQPGDYVLTTCSKRVPLHFVVNKIAVPGQPRIMYHFEEEPFETVTQLIQYYVHNRKPVTASSGAVISVPVLRSGPVQCHPDEMLSRSQVLPSAEDPQKDAMRHKRTGSQPLLTIDTSEPSKTDVSSRDMRHGSLPFIGKTVLSAIKVTDANVQPTALLSHQRSDSEPSLSPVSRNFPQNINEAAVRVTKHRPKESGPPKPSRVPTVKKRAMERPLMVKRNQALYEDDGKDYSDYEQVKSSPGCKSTDERSLRDVLTAKIESSSIGMFENAANSNGVHQSLVWLNTLVSTGARSLKSYFEDLHAYENNLLAVENRPLDCSAFATMKSLILQTDAVKLARHLTVLDLELVKITGSYDFGFGVTSGLELITLPQGHFLRQDIIERHFSLKLFVSLTILYCVNRAECVNMMHKWIQIAHELRSCLGNLFGFSAVMDGLMAKQVCRLEKSWLLLEQQHGTSYFLFTNLHSFLRSLDDATSILPIQNITVPHILPLAVLLQEEHTASFIHETPAKKLEMDSLFSHLNKARAIAQQCAVYRKTAENLVAESALDQLLLDVLSPLTHLKFLWGSKGIRALQCDRFNKFEEILDVLSLKAGQSSSSSVIMKGTAA